MRFVHFKIKKIQGMNKKDAEKKLLQIIDVSNKMLYNEAKAEKTYLNLINAAVSHELRNPLNSIVAAVSTLMKYIYDLYLVIDDIEDLQV